MAVTAFVVNDDGENTADPFSALRYITFLTIGYMIARGLAKSAAAATPATTTDPLTSSAPHLHRVGRTAVHVVVG